MARFAVQTQNGTWTKVAGRCLGADRGLVLVFSEDGSIVAAYGMPQEIRLIPDDMRGLKAKESD